MPSYDVVIQACKRAMPLNKGGTPLIAKYLSKAELPTDSTKNYSVKGKRIRNVGEPREDHNAATKRYVDELFQKNEKEFASSIKENEKEIASSIKKDVQNFFAIQDQKYDNIFKQIIQVNIDLCSKLEACIRLTTSAIQMFRNDIKNLQNDDVNNALRDIRDNMEIVELELQTLKNRFDTNKLQDELGTTPIN